MARSNWNNTVSSFISSWNNYFRTMGVKKEDIIIEDIYHLGGSGTGARMIANNKDLELGDIDEDTRKVVQGIASTYDENIKFKEEMLNRSRLLYDTTTVQTIIDVALDDGFNNFKEDEDFVISYEPDSEDTDTLGEEFIKEIQEEIDSFVEKSGIKDIAADILPEIIRDGEHALVIKKVQGEGITGINDDIDVKDMLPYYRGNKLTFVFEKTKEDKGFIQQEKIRLYKPDNIIFFRLKHFNKKKLNLDTLGLTNEAKSKFKEVTKLKIPKYIRICLPLYYSALDDIENLQAMEKLNVAQDFVNLLRNQVLGIGVPQNATSEDTKKIIREYERHLNEVKQAVDTFKDMTVDDLIGLSRERKLIPLFSDGKGSVTPLDLNNGTKIAESRDSVSNQKSQVALTTGFPAYYFTTTEAPQDKPTALKLYSRFTKKLSSLQVCLSEGVEEIIYQHLIAKNKNVKRSHIKVKFKALTNGDILDEIDVMVATITGLADMYDALEKIASSENNELSIDSNKLKEVWDIYTSNLVNISGLLKKDENKFVNTEGDTGFDTFGDRDNPFSGGRPPARRSTGIEPANEPEQPDLSPSEEEAVDRSNAESEADFVNSTSAEL